MRVFNRSFILADTAINRRTTTVYKLFLKLFCLLQQQQYRTLKKTTTSDERYIKIEMKNQMNRKHLQNSSKFICSPTKEITKKKNNSNNSNVHVKYVE